MSPDPEPRDNAAERRFEVDADGGLAFAEYAIDDGTITFFHTFVPEAARGHGVASRLARAGLDAARARHLSVVPQCPLFVSYMTAHPETQDLLSAEGRAAMSD